MKESTLSDISNRLYEDFYRFRCIGFLGVWLRNVPRPLRVVRQPQVPQRPVEMLLLRRSCAHQAVVQMIPIAASSCAGGLCHGGEVAKVVGQKPDGIVRPGLDHLQDGPAQQLSDSGLRQKVPVAVRFVGFPLGQPWRSHPGPALLLVRHSC